MQSTFVPSIITSNHISNLLQSYKLYSIKIASSIILTTYNDKIREWSPGFHVLKICVINFHSHLKNRREILIHITAMAIITITGMKTLFIGRPSEAALRSLIPCVNGRRSAAFWNAEGITS